MQFELTNVPCVFEQTMDRIVADLKCICVPKQLADILISSKNVDVYEEHIGLEKC